ncbi:hypothetical protein PENTCL1PPCAC_13359, partial [Pristionchus entomophagus]
SDVYQYFVVLHVVLVFLSLLNNGTMHTTLITMRKKLFESTFYIVVAGLMIFTTLKTLIQAAFIVPQYMLRNDPFSAEYRKTMFTLDMVADYGILGFSTLMAANRLSAFQMGAYGPLFVKPVIYYLFGLVTVFIIFCGVIMSGMGCRRQYNSQTNTYVDTCPSDMPTLVIQKVLMSLFYVFCILSFSFYFRTYWLIKSQRGYLMNNENNRFRPEMAILHQAIIIFVLYLTWIVISNLLLFFLNDSASVYFYLSYSLNIASICIAATFPGLFLTSNAFRR